MISWTWVNTEPMGRGHVPTCMGWCLLNDSLKQDECCRDYISKSFTRFHRNGQNRLIRMRIKQQESPALLLCAQNSSVIIHLLIQLAWRDIHSWRMNIKTYSTYNCTSYCILIHSCIYQSFVNIFKVGNPKGSFLEHWRDHFSGMARL